MASIVKRNNRYCVVYAYKRADGTQKQKWETFNDLADAKNRKKEVEYKESIGTFVAPQCRTLNDLLTEYVTLYGKTKWALSTYQSNTALISNYITPLIGSMKLQDITTRVIEDITSGCSNTKPLTPCAESGNINMFLPERFVRFTKF